MDSNQRKKIILCIVLCVYLVAFGFFTIFIDQRVSEEKKLIPKETKEPTTEILDARPLWEQIDTYLKDKNIPEEMIGISVSCFDQEDTFYDYNGNQEFIAASTYKVPLAMLWYDKIAQGRAQLSGTLPYGANCYEMGGPIGDTYAPGSYISLQELLDAMIVYSDNTAGHILFESLGGWEQFKEDAAKYSTLQLNHQFFSNENYLSPNYCRDVMKYLYEHKETYLDLIQNMKKSKKGDYLDAKINVSMPQKYGEYDSFENAIGFVEAKHAYSICIFTELGSMGIDVMSEIKAMCYAFFNQ